MSLTLTPTNLAGKPHFQILDGLRGIAALLVVVFHIFEAHATSHFDQVINHGYLAVDFFFLLSGFVIGYAYDDRWNTLSLTDFFKRRLLRLQPMVVMGMVIGAILFYPQASGLFPGISDVPLWQLLLVLLVGCTLIPLPPSMDIRGWKEMHSLNGPGWSLFFEYLANILYALVVRKFSVNLLSFLVLLFAIFLFHLALTSQNGDVVGGWSLEPAQLHIGFARMLYPFFAGLLLSRTAKLVLVKHAFLLCSVLLTTVLVMPRIGGDKLWMNGLYDAISIIVFFPFIVFLGASGKVENKVAGVVCNFLADISYPIYITHYPLIYWYTGWVVDRKLTIWQAFPVNVMVFFGSVLLAYALLKFYDEPVRAWLKRKLPEKNIA